ncbi:MAG: OsmC family protein [Acidobacteriota bacterium]|nr:OsmC family protein [Acidobacteriota bacterium]
MEARQIDASNGKLVSETVGEIETDGGVLVIRRVHVVYKLRAPESARETIERVHEMHADFCPVARSLRPAIDISTAFEIIPE